MHRAQAEVLRLRRVRRANLFHFLAQDQQVRVVHQGEQSHHPSRRTPWSASVCGQPERGPLGFRAFHAAGFSGVPPASNIYFAHPYVVDNELVLIMPLAFPHGGKPSGVYVAHCLGEMHLWSAPLLLIESVVYEGRTEDLPAAGAQWDGRHVTVLMHRWVRKRMSPARFSTAPAECLQWHHWDLPLSSHAASSSWSWLEHGLAELRVTGPNRSPEEKRLGKAIVAMYSQHNPGELVRIEDILTKYAGEEALTNLLLAFRNKYEPGHAPPPPQEPPGVQELPTVGPALPAPGEPEPPGVQEVVLPLGVFDCVPGLLEIHVIAHTQFDVPALQEGWSHVVRRMGEANGDLCLLLVGNDSWLEWVVILRKVTQWAPCQWRTAADWQKELKGHISLLVEAVRLESQCISRVIS